MISSVGAGKNGEIFNINADTAASFIAKALKADRLIMMTDVAGIMRDKDDIDTLFSELTISQAEELKAQRVITQGMIPKIECCIQAIKDGVRKVIIMNGTIPHSILMELFTKEGAGTLIKEK